MEILIEHINIQVEELQSNNIIKWNDIISILSQLQEYNIGLSDALVNMITQIKKHYIDDMNQAKNLYCMKAKQYEIAKAKLEINEIENNSISKSDNDEYDDSENSNESINGNEMIFSELGSIENFNFPKERISMMDELVPNIEISPLSSYEIFLNDYETRSVQKESEDAKIIDNLISQNNQYLKLATSWKKQCKALMLKVEEMKKMKMLNISDDL